jgi:GWxTD domain-containing protein
LFSKANEEDEFKSEVKLNYRLYEILEDQKTELKDSSTYNYSFEKDEDMSRYLIQIPLNAIPGRKYELKITATDILRNSVNVKYIIIDKSSVYGPQNFNVTDQYDNPYFDPKIIGDRIFKIKYRDNSIDTFFVKYYRPDTSVPKPIRGIHSADFIYSNPDSIWKYKYSESVFLQLPEEGIYLFQADTSVPKGLSLYNYGRYFPNVEEIDQLIEPLAYLSTKVEFKRITDAQNKKIAVDDFWLERAGNVDRARELIRIYYNRVYFANYYFTNNREGWKTDRGMVYIVYGPPQNIVKSTDEEKWFYYRRGSGPAIVFTFGLKESPFCNNDYILERSESQGWHWREAFDSWRNGKIFLLE